MVNILLGICVVQVEGKQRHTHIEDLDYLCMNLSDIQGRSSSATVHTEGQAAVLSVRRDLPVWAWFYDRNWSPSEYTVVT